MSNVDKLYQDLDTVITYLQENEETSLAATTNENARKVLLLAAASSFENLVVEGVLRFIRESSGSNLVLVEFVQNKALKRQYHTLFDWDKPNANRFFSLFGEDFKKYMIDALNNDPPLEEGMKAFMEIGRERNRLVHQDFATYTLEKTTQEIYARYKQALYFVESIPVKLREFAVGRRQTESN